MHYFNSKALPIKNHYLPKVKSIPIICSSLRWNIQKVWYIYLIFVYKQFLSYWNLHLKWFQIIIICILSYQFQKKQNFFLLNQYYLIKLDNKKQHDLIEPLKIFKIERLIWRYLIKSFEFFIRKSTTII